MPVSLDIAFLADPRFMGGTSTSLAAEIRASYACGLTCGLMMVRRSVPRRSRPVHPQLRELIETGICRVLDPADSISVRLAVVHHPLLFAVKPATPIRLSSGAVVLVLHHPEVDAAGTPQYDLRKVTENVAFALNRRPLIAPVGPLVRATLKGSQGLSVLTDDWHNLIDIDDFSPRASTPPRSPLVIGRHTRPELEKWPDDRATAEAVYPSSSAFRVRMLGGDSALLAQQYGELPRNWEVIPFDGEKVADFLGSLDFYVYFHSKRWIEAFGRNILEALAAGLVVIVPPQFQPLFGKAAVYAAPHEVQDVIAAFVADPERYRRQSADARSVTAERFGLQRFRERFDALASPRNPPPPPSHDRAVRDRILMVTSNGIGLGHLTRLLAIAKRLPGDLQPVFFTLSQAVGIAREAGYLAEFVPFHRYLDVSAERWTNVFRAELAEALSFYRPRALVFDGTVPYGGLVETFAGRDDMLTVWVRRAMWTEAHAGALKRASHFDVIVEPGEIAAAFDVGPTHAVTNVHRVGPIISIDPGQRLTREAAREALGVAPDKMLVALQLGAGNNFSFGAMRDATVSELMRHPDVEIVEFVSPVSDAATPPGGPRHQVRTLYPSFTMSRAFDFAISAAGYNSFHENILGAVPTVFVPNEADGMDRQIARARYAELAGCGRLLQTRDIYSARATIAGMMEPGERQRLIEGCERLAVPNEAAEAARFIAESARFVRADRDPSL